MERKNRKKKETPENVTLVFDNIRDNKQVEASSHGERRPNQKLRH